MMTREHELATEQLARKIASEHGALRGLVQGLHSALDDPGGAQGSLSGLLSHFERQLWRHFSVEESGRYFRSSGTRSSQARRALADVFSEHPELLARVREIRTQFNSRGPLAEIKQELRDFLSDLARHEAIEDGILRSVVEKE